MEKIVKRAGLTPWPKLFHNLRASRQTELTQQGFAEHVVCEWLGNSQAVAREHYLRVTEADFEAAFKVGEPKWVPLVAPPDQNGSHFGNPPGVAQNCLLLQIVKKALKNDGFEQVLATVGKAMQETKMTPGGLEPPLPP